MDTPSAVSYGTLQESYPGNSASTLSQTSLSPNELAGDESTSLHATWTKEAFVAALREHDGIRLGVQKSSAWTRAAWVEALSAESFASLIISGDFSTATDSALQHHASRLRPMPRSATDLLASRCIDIIVDLGLSNTWYAFAPSMIGQTAALDFAARALVLHREPANIRTIIRDELPSYTAYRIALESLRTSLDASDFSLVTTGLLGLYEMLRKDHAAALHTHAQGVSAIIDAHFAEGRPASPVVRAAFYCNTVMTFSRPVFMGEASPFDRPSWLTLDPATIGPMQTPIRKLVKLTQKVTLRLPRLIAMVRGIRQSNRPTADAVTSASRLADGLLALKDDSLEDEVLSTVKLLPSTRRVGSPLDSDLFLFESIAARDAMLMYWAARLMAVKLCLVLCRIQERNRSLPELYFSRSKLEHEQASLILCVLMCWNDGFGHVNIFNILWCALMGRKDVRGHDAQTIRTWIMWKHEEELSGWGLQYGPEDADVDADILAGGPLKGFHLQRLREFGLIPSDAQGLEPMVRGESDEPRVNSRSSTILHQEIESVDMG